MADPSLRIPGSDNITDMPNDPGDTGWTGEVIGTRDQMPIGSESKRVGFSNGGKHTLGTWGLEGWRWVGTDAREMGGSGPGFPH